MSRKETVSRRAFQDPYQRIDFLGIIWPQTSDVEFGNIRCRTHEYYRRNNGQQHEKCFPFGIFPYYQSCESKKEGYPRFEVRNGGPEQVIFLNAQIV